MARYQDDEDDRPRRSERGFRCAYCGSREIPVVRKKTTTAGWIFFGVFLIGCFPLCWIGLLISEEQRVCGDCGMRLG